MDGGLRVAHPLGYRITCSIGGGFDSGMAATSLHSNQYTGSWTSFHSMSYHVWVPVRRGGGGGRNTAINMKPDRYTTTLYAAYTWNYLWYKPPLVVAVSGATGLGAGISALRLRTHTHAGGGWGLHLTRMGWCSCPSCPNSMDVIQSECGSLSSARLLTPGAASNTEKLR